MFKLASVRPRRAPARRRGRKVRGWRKLAGATWGPPVAPQFFGELEIEAEAPRPGPGRA